MFRQSSPGPAYPIARLLLAVAFPLAALGMGLAPAQDGGTADSNEARPVLVRWGSFASERKSAARPDRYRLVSYNLHGPPTGRINRILEVLRSEPVLKDAAVYLLQEVNRGHRGSGNLNLDEHLARHLNLNYAYAFENLHPRGGGERGLAIMSPHTLSDIERVLLPVVGPGGRRRIALGATVDLDGFRMRVYTLHLETRISTRERARQIQGVLDDAQRYSGMPIAIMGDFNTITGSSRRMMFRIMEGAGYRCPLAGDKKTFQQKFLFRFVLDWIWLKNLAPVAADVETHITVSDHRPLWVEVMPPT